MTVANFRYNYLEQPWDSPLSFGVQSFIEFNGLVLNDRNQADRIRVTGITGLDGAEIRDSREPIPGAHGEFPYDAFYGGRNIVLNGTIEAGSLPVSNELKRNLLAAFAPLVESPLKFRWFDIYDNFDDPQTIFPYSPIATVVSGNYEALIGTNSNFSVEGGYLSWAKTGNDYLLRVAEKRVFGDVQSTIEITPGSLTVASTFGFIFGVKNSENYCRCLYSQNSGEPFISIETIVGGEVFNIGKVEIPAQNRPQIGIPFFLRGRKEGNYLAVEFWSSSPSNYNLPTIAVTTEMEGTDASTFGDAVLAQVGFGGEQKDILWRFNNYRIESLYPGDVIFNARCITTPQIKDEQTSLTKYKRQFQITLRSSDFRAISSTQIRKTIVPSSSSESAELGLSFSIGFPLSFRKYINKNLVQKNNILSINNRGTVFVDSFLIIYGPFNYVALKNLTNGQEIYFRSAIAENDYLIIDCSKKKTVTNSIGQNQLENFASSSSAWMTLEPKWNDIYITGTGFNENSSKLAIYSQHGYLG